MRRNIEANQNHPSVLAVVGRQRAVLPARPGAGRLHPAARARSPSSSTRRRPSAIAFAGYPAAGCQTEYAPLDIIGVNEYFGWYPGPGGQIFDRTGCRPYLDQVRRCYPRAGDLVIGVRRRGQPRRPGRGEGHLGLPAGLRQLPPRRVRAEAVAERRDLLGAQRVPRAPGLGGRQPAPAAAGAPEGPAALRHLLAQARVGGRAALLHRDASSTRSGQRRTRRGAAARARAPRRRAGRGRGREALVPAQADAARARRRAAGGRRTGRSWAGAGRRSLPPPPPPSSSSGGFHGVGRVRAQEHHEQQHARAPARSRCSAPKMSISSSSGDIACEIYPDREGGRPPVR